MAAPDAERRPLPYYRWYWQDWRGNRAVQRMTPLARGLYRELLDEQWAEGFVPDDADKCAEICGIGLAEFEREWPAIRARFVLRAGRALVNERLEAERTSVDNMRVQKSLHGRRGGLAKSAHGSDLQRPLKSASARHIVEESRGEKRRVLTANAAVAADSVADFPSDRQNEEYVVGKWNALATSRSWPLCTVVNATRRRSIKARIREKGWIERLPAAIAFLQVSAWHTANPIGIDTFLRPGKVDAYAEKAGVAEGGARTVKPGPRQDVDRAALDSLEKTGGANAAKGGSARGAEDLL